MPLSHTAVVDSRHLMNEATFRNSRAIFQRDLPSWPGFPLSHKTTDRRVRVIVFEDLCEEVARIKKKKKKLKSSGFRL
jgi:hypothetical protein